MEMQHGGSLLMVCADSVVKDEDISVAVESGTCTVSEFLCSHRVASSAKLETLSAKA